MSKDNVIALENPSVKSKDPLTEVLRRGASKLLAQAIEAEVETLLTQLAFGLFIAAYEQKYPKAAECLEKDREALLAFYDFPAEHWVHPRTTNPIESTFSTVRLRTDKTRGSLLRETTLTMVFKLFESAQKRWRRLNGAEYLSDVYEGVEFQDGSYCPGST